MKANRGPSKKKIEHEQIDKYALKIRTLQTISQVLTLPAYLWLNTNHLRNFRSDNLFQEKSCKERSYQYNKEKFQ